MKNKKKMKESMMKEVKKILGEMIKIQKIMKIQF